MAYRMVPEKIAKTVINSLDGRKIEITADDCTVCPNCDIVPPWWNLDARGSRCSECGYVLGKTRSVSK